MCIGCTVTSTWSCRSKGQVYDTSSCVWVCLYVFRVSIPWGQNSKSVRLSLCGGIQKRKRKESPRVKNPSKYKWRYALHTFVCGVYRDACRRCVSRALQYVSTVQCPWNETQSRQSVPLTHWHGKFSFFLRLGLVVCAFFYHDHVFATRLAWGLIYTGTDSIRLLRLGNVCKLELEDMPVQIKSVWLRTRKWKNELEFKRKE